MDDIEEEELEIIYREYKDRIFLLIFYNTRKLELKIDYPNSYVYNRNKLEDLEIKLRYKLGTSKFKEFRDKVHETALVKAREAIEDLKEMLYKDQGLLPVGYDWVHSPPRKYAEVFDRMQGIKNHNQNMTSLTGEFDMENPTGKRTGTPLHRRVYDPANPSTYMADPELQKKPAYESPLTPVTAGAVSSSSQFNSPPMDQMEVSEVSAPSQRYTGSEYSQMSGYQLDPSSSTGRPANLPKYDAQGYAIPFPRWKRAGDPENKALMAALKRDKPQYYKSLIYRKWDRKNFPGNRFGKAYFERGVPGSWSMNTFGRSYAEADEAQKANRKKYGFRGYGAYWGKVLGAGAGRFLGSKIGMGNIGAAVGGRLGDLGSDYIERKLGISGSGAYDAPNIMSNETLGNFGSFSNQMSTNSLINNATRTRYLGALMDESNSICIAHTEFITDVVSTKSDFQTLAFLSINPGLASTFPWLSNIAQFYEEYMFEQLTFSFKSMVTEGNSTAAGTVIMATQYNPANPRFTNKQQMENYDFSQSCKVTADAIHGIECDEQKRGGPAIEYVRTGGVPAGQDIKTFDMATFQLAISGGMPNLTVGELWVSYKVRLGKSKIYTPGALGRQNIAFASIELRRCSATNSAFLGDGSTTVGSEGTPKVVTNMSGLQIVNTADNSLLTNLGTLVFPENVVSGTYLLQLSYTTGTAATAAPTLTASNCTVQSLQTDDSLTTLPNSWLYQVVISAPNPLVAKIDVSGLTTLGTTTAATGLLRLWQVYSTN